MLQEAARQRSSKESDGNEAHRWRDQVPPWAFQVQEGEACDFFLQSHRPSWTIALQCGTQTKCNTFAKKKTPSLDLSYFPKAEKVRLETNLGQTPLTAAPMG